MSTKVEILKKLRQVTLHVFRAHSIDQMRSMIKEELPRLCEVDSISIHPQTSTPSKELYIVSLEPDYHLYFKKNQGFSAEDKKFLNQVSKAIKVNFQKIGTHDQLCSLKEQWKSTFNAIPKPICLTDENFLILSTNRAFMKQISTYDKPPKNIYRSDCFSVFFGSPIPEEEKNQLLKKKIFKETLNPKSTFELHCQSFQKRGGEVRLIIFTDRTQQIEMERKISRLSDQAEMGIIASSIAHELNNPLGGIQALLQISSATDSKTKDKISEMLYAVKRCQKIVQHLLGSKPQEDSSLHLEVRPTENTL